MRRVLVVLITVSALVLLVQRLRVWLAPETTRIRWRLEEMEEGFNQTVLGSCMRGVASNWRDETSGTGRDQLADGLRGLFFSEKDPATGRFPYRVELERDALAIEIDPEDPRRASVEVVARFSVLERDEWTTTWRVRVRARLVEDERLGWQVERSEHETLESDGRLRRRL